MMRSLHPTTAHLASTCLLASPTAALHSPTFPLGFTAPLHAVCTAATPLFPSATTAAKVTSHRLPSATVTCGGGGGGHTCSEKQFRAMGTQSSAASPASQYPSMNSVHAYTFETPTALARVTKINGVPFAQPRAAGGDHEVSAAREKTGSGGISNKNNTKNRTSVSCNTAATNTANRFNAHQRGGQKRSFSLAPSPSLLATTAANYLNSGDVPIVLNTESPYGCSAAVACTAQDQREAANKVWNSLHTTTNNLHSALTGAAGTARITHNLNHGNARWQASCVEVRTKDKEEDLTSEDPDLNPVIAKRNKQFGQLLPWEKIAYEQKSKFPKSDKFPPDDNVEIVFYFETHDTDGMGLMGYQNIAARVSAGELPGECANLTAVGGFATWTVPRSEFVAMTESKPLLGDMLSETPLKRAYDKQHETKGPGVVPDLGRHQQCGVAGGVGSHSEADEEQLRTVTIRMSTASDMEKAATLERATVV